MNSYLSRESNSQTFLSLNIFSSVRLFYASLSRSHPLCHNLATLDILPHKNLSKSTGLYPASQAIQLSIRWRHSLQHKGGQIHPLQPFTPENRNVVFSVRCDLADKVGRSLQGFIGRIKLIQHSMQPPPFAKKTIPEVTGFGSVGWGWDEMRCECRQWKAKLRWDRYNALLSSFVVREMDWSCKQSVY